MIIISTLYLGKASFGTDSVGDYSLYIKDGNLVLSYKEYKPLFSIENNNLVFTSSTEETIPVFSLDEYGRLIEEVI